MMGLTPIDSTLCATHKTFFNAAVHLQPENKYRIAEARNILAKKNVTKGNVILKLKKRIMQPVRALHCHKVCKTHVISTTMSTSTIMAPTYSYQQDYNYPITMNDWQQHSSLVAMQSVPVIIPTTNSICSTHLTPMVETVVQPIVSQILPQTLVAENLADILTRDYNYLTEQLDRSEEIANENLYYLHEEVSRQANSIIFNANISNASIEVQPGPSDPMETYLNLPKELFPTPSMLELDPNPVIDEICKLPNLQRHLPWILDLEFGIPKTIITRPIPIYNVKFNSIHCKNAPEAIHPAFERCNADFKKALLFYYDCIISAWYRGYMILHCDRSVENFQSWLLLPMQVLGMCWP